MKRREKMGKCLVGGAVRTYIIFIKFAVLMGVAYGVPNNCSCDIKDHQS